MNKPELKAKILDVCKNVQSKNIDTLKYEMEDAQKMANDYGCPRDRYDADRAQLLSKRDLFASQLQKSRELLDVLNIIPLDKQFDKVDFGAVVVTSNQKMFISVSIGKIEVDGETYYAISPMVPVYKAMQGKEIGDTFIFNGNKVDIVDIF